MSEKKIKIIGAQGLVRREPLQKPFGFKGGNLTELWQVVVQLKSIKGNTGIGLGVQSVLWSDPDVFCNHSEAEGNRLMFQVTQQALQILKDNEYISPINLQDRIFDEVYEYAKRITHSDSLRKTFVLNALMPVDYAVWLLYAHENRIDEFDSLIPSDYRESLSARNSKLAALPIVSYGKQENTIRDLTDQGYFFLKIKIGHPGTATEMLEKDKAWLSLIHQLMDKVRTPHTPDGKIRYYLDANGRYLKKDHLQSFIDHLDKIGAKDQVAILEEPFPEDSEIDASDLGLRIAMDESAHSEKEVLLGIQKGYNAIALKPIAKTLSNTLKILKRAYSYNIPCFCADLTATPVMVEWNKNIAARLAPFPGLNFNLLETNGHQNYKNWDALRRRNPCYDAPWTQAKEGVFELNEDFYKRNKCILEPPLYYQQLFNE